MLKANLVQSSRIRHAFVQVVTLLVIVYCSHCAVETQNPCYDIGSDRSRYCNGCYNASAMVTNSRLTKYNFWDDALKVLNNSPDFHDRGKIEIS